MNKEYLTKIKEQYPFMFDNEERYLILSDDLDSFLSVMLLLQYRPNYKLGYFYSYESGLYANMSTDLNIESVGVDISLCKGKCISNHMSVLNPRDKHINKEDLNMNIVTNTTASTYFQKYNLNTFLLIASLVGHKFTSDKARATALLPDSSFLAYYLNPKYEAVAVQEKYLKLLGFSDVYEVQKKYTKQTFYNGQDQLNTKAKLFVNEYGELQFDRDIPIELICETLGINYNPSISKEGFFFLKEKHRGFKTSINSNVDKDDLFAFTITDRNNIKYMKKVV